MELHTPKGEVLTVNLSKVLFIYPCKKGTTIVFIDGLAEYTVTECYEDLAAKFMDLSDC